MGNPQIFHLVIRLSHLDANQIDFSQQFMKCVPCYVLDFFHEGVDVVVFHIDPRPAEHGLRVEPPSMDQV